VTPLAASILGYVLGLATAAGLNAIWKLVRGGSTREDDWRRRERFSTKGRGW
jgi:hypothetical protein